jgi:hypothetical protein
MEKDKDKSMSELLEKDDKIIKMSRELRDYERKLADINSVFNTNQNNNITKDFMISDSQHCRHISYSPISHDG